jgi:hypothetical protein
MIIKKTTAIKSGVLLLLLGVADASLADGKRVAFVGCPVVRDMELPARPCWLAQNGDKLYFIGMQGDTFPPATFYPPQLKHRVLVEAEEGEGQSICGGLPLNQVKVSVLPDLDLSCDMVLPSAGFAPGPELRPSPPFRKGRGLASDPNYPRAQSYPAPPPPEPPFQARTFRLEFAFDEDFVHLPESFVITGAAAYFEAIKAGKLTLDVYRDRVELDDGTILEEDATVAQRRADRMLNLLTSWGVPTSKIETHLSSQPARGGRYLTLTVSP